MTIISNLDLLFIAYQVQSGKTKAQIAEMLQISPKTMSGMWKNGVGTWRFSELLKVAHFIGIPIDTLREEISYQRKDF